ncbi:MAG: hypothetical protein ABIA77_04150, partial [Candidatus Omnitrophota bacterium]
EYMFYAVISRHAHRIVRTAVVYNEDLDIRDAVDGAGQVTQGPGQGLLFVVTGYMYDQFTFFHIDILLATRLSHPNAKIKVDAGNNK